MKKVIITIIIMVIGLGFMCQKATYDDNEYLLASETTKIEVKKDLKNAQIYVENAQEVANNDQKEAQKRQEQEEKERQEKEAKKEQEAKVAQEEKEASSQSVIQEGSYSTRLTSFYVNDGYGTSSTTGSGLSSSNFSVNDKGWYTYSGHLVIATATTYLVNYGYTLAQGVHTYKYYDILTLTIDGVDYTAIVLDSCGSCMKNDRIDLFVSGAQYVKDANIIVKE